MAKGRRKTTLINTTTKNFKYNKFIKFWSIIKYPRLKIIGETIIIIELNRNNNCWSIIFLWFIIIKHEIINPKTLTRDAVKIEMNNEFAKAFKKILLNINCEKSAFIKSAIKTTIGENKKNIKKVIRLKSIIFINLKCWWGWSYCLILISKKLDPFNLKNPINTKNRHIHIWIKLRIMALSKFNSNRAYWYIATSSVEFFGPPPSAITIAKLKKHNEKIIEKIVKRFCFIIGSSNFMIFPIIDKLKVLEIS